ncbi:amidohydrolase [Anaeromicrobium sediminis]|uniref:Peptidase M20 n=1 Tax=Anaeromicrobium sediminis TaxID=1478221 RepID=A0A267MJI5_9FIRM|nr:amidohydrolase [Anaeromicrobium sediminis]PAB59582.1 peptidase M20 [Anaeromicrobium sediminis]
MQNKIQLMVDTIEEKIINARRDFHKYAESGWTEFRTASIVARKLKDLGYDLLIGREVIRAEDRMGVPSEEVLHMSYERAKIQGAELEFLEQMKGGYTGVVGVLDNGDGPVIGIRFDMDAVEVEESIDENHYPYLNGFSSVNEGSMHACGHDGHTAIGLGVAEVLMNIKDSIKGKVKLVFQPAEEGVRGAKSIANSGVLDDVDYMFGGHIGIAQNSSGKLFCGMGNFLATTKLNAYFKGVAAHAGISPEGGKNTLLAAATGTLNLQGIPRHGDGITRINVGKLVSGSGRNVIPSEAYMEIETRGSSSKLNKYMEEKTIKILKSCAHMYDVELTIKEMGSAENEYSDEEAIERVKFAAQKIKSLREIIDRPVGFGGSEDFSYMMKKVHKNGGKATYILFGSDIKGPHHNGKFDFDEKDMINAVKVFSVLAYDILKK